MEAAAKPDDQSIYGPAAHDPMIEPWIAMAEAGSSMGVTLQIGGLLVSGEIINAPQWLELLGDQIAKAIEGKVEPEQTEQLKGAMRKRADAWRNEMKARGPQPFAGNESGPGPLREYIHLKNAEVWAGNTLNHFPIWRGRLSAIDGWALGVRNKEP